MQNDNVSPMDQDMLSNARQTASKAAGAAKDTAKAGKAIGKGAAAAATGDVGGLIKAGMELLNTKLGRILLILVLIALWGPLILAACILFVVLGNVINCFWAVFQPENAMKQAEHALKRAEDGRSDTPSRTYRAGSDMTEADAENVRWAATNENYNSTYLDYVYVIENKLDEGIQAGKNKYKRRKAETKSYADSRPHEDMSKLYNCGDGYYSTTAPIPYTEEKPTRTVLTQSDADAVTNGGEAYDIKRLGGVVWNEPKCGLANNACYEKGITQVIAAFMTMKADTTYPSEDSNAGFMAGLMEWWKNITTSYSHVVDFQYILQDADVLEDMYDYQEIHGCENKTGQYSVYKIVPVKGKIYNQINSYTIHCARCGRSMGSVSGEDRELPVEQVICGVKAKYIRIFSSQTRQPCSCFDYETPVRNDKGEIVRYEKHHASRSGIPGPYSGSNHYFTLSANATPVQTYYYKEEKVKDEKYEYDEEWYSADLGEFQTDDLIKRIFVRFGTKIWNYDTVKFTKAGTGGYLSSAGGGAGFSAGATGTLEGNPNFADKTIYTNAAPAGMGGQCTWFVRCRILEIYGYNMGWHTGNGVQSAAVIASEHPDMFTFSMSNPEPGSVISVGTGNIGHVAFISEVNADGSIVVEEGNIGYGGWMQSWAELNVAYSGYPFGGASSSGFCKQKWASISQYAATRGAGGFAGLAVPTAKAKSMMKNLKSSDDDKDKDKDKEKSKDRDKTETYYQEPNGPIESGLRIAEELAKYGMSVNAIAAMLGNCDQESGYNPACNLNSPGLAFGLFQWLDRRASLCSWLRSNGYALDSIEGQIRYLVEVERGAWLLRRDHVGATDAVVKVGMSWDEFMKSTDPVKDLAATFCAYFERCGVAEIRPDRRFGTAEWWYEYLSENGFGSSVKEENMILVGDSRFVGIQSDVHPSGTVVAKVGANMNTWKTDLKGQLDSRLSSISDLKGYAVIFGFGVNDIGNSDEYVRKMAREYASYYNKYAADNPDLRVFALSVNPISFEDNRGYVTISSRELTNQRIELFNETLKASLSEDVTYLDCYSEIKDSFKTSDGLHYDSATNQRIYDFIKEKVCSSSISSAAAGQSSGEWRETTASDFRGSEDQRLNVILGAPYQPYQTFYHYECGDEHGPATNPEHCPECKSPTVDRFSGGGILNFISGTLSKWFKNLTPKYEFVQNEKPKADIFLITGDEVDLLPGEELGITYKPAYGKAPENSYEGSEGQASSESSTSAQSSSVSSAPQTSTAFPSTEASELYSQSSSSTSSSEEGMDEGADKEANDEALYWAPRHIYTVQDQINWYVDNIYFGVDGKNSDGTDMADFPGGARSREDGADTSGLHVNLFH